MTLRTLQQEPLGRSFPGMRMPLRLGKLNLITARVDLCEHLAGFNDSAFFEANGHQLTIDTWLDRHCVSGDVA